MYFLLVSAAAQSKPSNPFQEADYLLTLGESLDRDKQSLAVIERALSNDGNNYQWLWRAARTYYYVGDGSAKNDKNTYFQKGIAIGQRAVAALPNAVEGHFWLAANYGGYSEQVGALKALQTVKKVRAEMEIVLRLNDRYNDGGAYLALGEMDRQLPRIVGGNLGRAIMRLEQGIKIAPQNLEIKIALAEAYKEKGRKEDARQQLQEVAGRPANPSAPQAERHAREKAQRLLAKL